MHVTLQQAGSAAIRNLLGCVAVALQVFACAALADETVEICFNYGCSHREEVRFEGQILSDVQAHLQQATSPAEERLRIGEAVAKLYVAAARTTPIWRDRGGNYPEDPPESGIMDCIDHSTNTTRFLGVMRKHNMLRFHEVGERLHRMRFLAEHWSAQIMERDSGSAYAVDSWYFDHGQPAAVMPVAEWRRGRDPREVKP